MFNEIKNFFLGLCFNGITPEYKKSQEMLISFQLILPWLKNCRWTSTVQLKCGNSPRRLKVMASIGVLSGKTMVLWESQRESNLIIVDPLCSMYPRMGNWLRLMKWSSFRLLIRLLFLVKESMVTKRPIPDWWMK